MNQCPGYQHDEPVLQNKEPLIGVLHVNTEMFKFIEPSVVKIEEHAQENLDIHKNHEKKTTQIYAFVIWRFFYYPEDGCNNCPKRHKNNKPPQQIVQRQH